MKLPEYVGEMLSRLRSRGFEAYAVGGCVRDFLLGKTPEDFDIATNALPEQIKDVFSDCRTVDTGISFGTVRVLLDGGEAEITTYRTDGAYTDFRRPDGVQFSSSLAEDLKRRDFTINALAFSPESGIVDMNGGREDLQKKVIRAIGSPEERFGEDALRILRALRFASVLGFGIERETSAAVHKLASLLKNISGERIYAELKKLLCGQNCEAVLREYHDVFAVFLPEIEKCRGFEQRTKYHDRDVYEHIIASVSAIAPVPHLRLAMLLHDIAKPDFFTLSPDGTGHFKGHAAGSVAAAQRLLQLLKTDSWTEERIVKLVKYHDMVIENREPLIKRYLNRFGGELFGEILDVHIADDTAKAPEYRGRIAVYEQVRKTAGEIIASRQCFSLKDLAVDGNDMIALGLSGKAVGDALKGLLEAVIDGKCENEKEKLLESAKGVVEK